MAARRAAAKFSEADYVARSVAATQRLMAPSVPAPRHSPAAPASPSSPGTAPRRSLMPPSLGLFQDDVVVKVLVVGAAGVGKSSILQRYIEDAFQDAYTPTIGPEFVAAEVRATHTHRPIRVHFWDLPLPEICRSKTLLRDVDGVFLVFDINDRRTMQAINDWREVLSEADCSSVPMMVLANKSDGKRHCILPLDLQRYAEDSGANVTWRIISARKGRSVRESIDVLLTLAVRALFRRTGASEAGTKGAKPLPISIASLAASPASTARSAPQRVPPGVALPRGSPSAPMPFVASSPSAAASSPSLRALASSVPQSHIPTMVPSSSTRARSASAAASGEAASFHPYAMAIQNALSRLSSIVDHDLGVLIDLMGKDSPVPIESARREANDEMSSVQRALRRCVENGDAHLLQVLRAQCLALADKWERFVRELLTFLATRANAPLDSGIPERPDYQQVFHLDDTREAFGSPSQNGDDNSSSDDVSRSSTGVSAASGHGVAATALSLISSAGDQRSAVSVPSRRWRYLILPSSTGHTT